MLALGCGPERTKKKDPHSSAPRVLDLRVVPRRVGGVPMSKGRYRTIEVKEVDWEAVGRPGRGGDRGVCGRCGEGGLGEPAGHQRRGAPGASEVAPPAADGGIGRLVAVARVEAVMESSGTYGDALRWQLRALGTQQGMDHGIGANKNKELPMNNLRPHTARRLRGTTSGTVPVRGSRRRSSTAASLCTRHCIRPLPHGYAAAPPARVTAFRRQMR